MKSIYMTCPLFSQANYMPLSAGHGKIALKAEIFMITFFTYPEKLR